MSEESFLGWGCTKQENKSLASVTQHLECGGKSKTMFPLLTVCPNRGVEASRHQDNCNSGLVCLLGGPADQLGWQLRSSVRSWRGVPGAAAVGIWLQWVLTPHCSLERNHKQEVL